LVGLTPLVNSIFTPNSCGHKPHRRTPSLYYKMLQSRTDPSDHFRRGALPIRGSGAESGTAAGRRDSFTCSSWTDGPAAQEVLPDGRQAPVWVDCARLPRRRARDRPQGASVSRGWTRLLDGQSSRCRKYATVSFSPSSRGTLGSHPSTVRALVISGHR
jgi:hypothetical protein